MKQTSKAVWWVSLACLAAGLLGFGIRALAVVPTTSDLVSYACDGTSTQFVFAFGVFATSDVQVVLVDSDDAESTLTENSDYTVTLPNGDGFLVPGGTVTTAEAYASGNRIVISRLPAITQASGYSTATTLAENLETVEDDFDRAVLRDQYLQRQIARALRAPGTDAEDFNLPVASLRANSMIGFDANGAPYMVASLLGPNDTNVSNYWHATLDDANWPDSVASLGFGGTLRDLLLLSAPNDYTVQQTIGGVRELDVRWFGATGDGVTDDTNAIQLAIDTAVAAGIGRKRVVIPEGNYVTSSPLRISGTQHIQIGGSGMIDFNDAGYAIVLRSDYCVLEDFTIRCGLTASGGLHVDGNDNQAQSNVIRNLRIMSQLAADKSEPNRCGIYVHAVSPYAAYFNTFAYNRIKGFYDGIVLRGESNANHFVANTIEYYYRYGLDINDVDESQMSCGFFQQAAGRDAGDLTYAVRIGTGGDLNLLLYGAEPGPYSSALDCNNSGNLIVVNDNCTYGTAGDGTPFYASPQGGLRLRRGVLAIGDSDTYAPLNIVERSSPPSAGYEHRIYLDAGPNTKSTFPAFKRHTGSGWEDVGRSGFVHVATTFDVNAADPNGSDYQFDNAQVNQTEQVKTLTNLLPAYAELLSVQFRCTETVTGSAAMSIDVGTASGGDQVLTAANTDTANDLNPTPAAGSPELAATNAARSICVNATPGVNWSTLTQGRWVLILTYLDYGALYSQKASE